MLEELKVTTPVEEMKTDIGRDEPPLSEKSIANLVGWLNFNVMQTKVTKFPADFYENNGRLSYEAIENMSGKTIPGRVSGGLTGVGVQGSGWTSWGFFGDLAHPYTASPRT